MNFVLSKTPLGALHWRVRFRTTVTYRPSIWILSRLPTCRSELGQPWHPPFPAKSPSHRPGCPPRHSSPERILRLTIPFVSRDCQSKSSQQSFWGSPTRLSETNGVTAAHVVSIICSTDVGANECTGTRFCEMHFEVDKIANRWIVRKSHITVLVRRVNWSTRTAFTARRTARLPAMSL